MSSNLTLTMKTHFKEKLISSHVKNLINNHPRKLEPRVGDTLNRISGLDVNIPPVHGGGELY